MLFRSGPRFRWDDEMKMHVTTDNVARPAQKVVELIELAESVLKPGERVTWKTLMDALQNARSTPDRRPVQSTVERWVAAMRKAEILLVEFGSYQLNPKLYLKSA